MRHQVRRRLAVSLLAVLILLDSPIHADKRKDLTDFSVSVKRVGCLGNCPEYEITILGDGQVRYEGQAYVRVMGVRERRISIAEVRRLADRLDEERFFDWKVNGKVCVDFPEVHISATLGGKRKHVLEGCSVPGKILDLANEIDRISGAKQWVR